MARPAPRPLSDDSPKAAYRTGLLILGRRELTSRQLHERLLRRGYPRGSADHAVAELQRTGALDDARAATAKARHGAVIRRHGKARVLREVRATGVDSEVAGRAVDEVFDDVSEDAQIVAAVSRKLHGSAPPTDPKLVRRLQGWLLRQGYDSGRIRRLLKAGFQIDEDE